MVEATIPAPYFLSKMPVNRTEKNADTELLRVLSRICNSLVNFNKVGRLHWEPTKYVTHEVLGHFFGYTKCYDEFSEVVHFCFWPDILTLHVTILPHVS